MFLKQIENLGLDWKAELCVGERENLRDRYNTYFNDETQYYT